jgi:hypothetical protein
MPRGVNRHDEASLQRRLWTPRHLPATRLSRRYSVADPGSLTTVSGAVSSWADLSGNAAPLTQASSGNRPGFSSAYFQGKPALTFDGSTSYLEESTLTVVAPYLVVVVVTLLAPMSGYRRIWHAGVGQDQYGYLGQASSGNYATFVGTGGGGGSWFDTTENSPGQPLSANRTHVLAMHNNGASGLIPYINGFKQTGKASATVSTTGFWLGAPYQLISFDLTQLFTGGVHELLILSSPTQQDIDRTIGFAAWKWNSALAASHPYANQPPLIGA